jgi:hypothetical protein
MQADPEGSKTSADRKQRASRANNFVALTGLLIPPHLSVVEGALPA